MQSKVSSTIFIASLHILLCHLDTFKLVNLLKKPIIIYSHLLLVQQYLPQFFLTKLEIKKLYQLFHGELKHISLLQLAVHERSIIVQGVEIVNPNTPKCIF